MKREPEIVNEGIVTLLFRAACRDCGCWFSITVPVPRQMQEALHKKYWVDRDYMYCPFCGKTLKKGGVKDGRQ